MNEKELEEFLRVALRNYEEELNKFRIRLEKVEYAIKPKLVPDENGKM